MKNGEFIIYRGYKITKVTGKDFVVGNKHYNTYFDAQRDIDIDIAEENALRNIDNYVSDICGGWL